MPKKNQPSSVRFTDVFKKMIELLMGERHFNDRTAYYEQLVRDDWDARVTPTMQAQLNAFLAEQGSASVLPVTPTRSSRGGRKVSPKGSRRISAPKMGPTN